MATEIPKPGDKVRIVSTTNTDYENFLGREFEVVECPDQWKNSPKYNDKIWVKYYMSAVYDIAVLPPNYEIVGQKPSIDVNVDVDERLKRQLNDNLRRVFG